MAEALLRVRGLRVAFPTAAGEVRALDGVSFDLARGARAGRGGRIRLRQEHAGLRHPPPAAAPGRVWTAEDRCWAARTCYSASPAALRRLRGGRVGMVFQDAAAALDGAFTVGSQLCETLRLLRPFPRAGTGGAPRNCWRWWAWTRRRGGSGSTPTSSPAGSGSG